MNERLQQLRKQKGLSRQAFGEMIGVSGDVINNLERGRVEIKDDKVKLICSIFNVNEEWFVDGIGDMFVQQTRDEVISQFIGNVQLDEDDNFKKRFISMLARLDESDWEVLEKMATEMAKDK